MPRPRWHKLPDARRDTVLDAVLDEVAGVGFAQASINRVLRAAGLSKGQLYYYFDDRNDLLATALNRLAGAVERPLIVPLLDTQEPEAFWEAIDDRYQAGMRWLLAHPRLRRIASWASTEHGGPAGPPTELGPFAARVGALSSELLTHGQVIGAVRTDLDPDLLLQMTLGLLFALDMWNLKQDALDPSRAAALVVDSCQRLLAPR